MVLLYMLRLYPPPPMLIHPKLRSAEENERLKASMISQPIEIDALWLWGMPDTLTLSARGNWLVNDSESVAGGAMHSVSQFALSV